MIWTVWMSALLLISIPEVHGLDSFPENLVLAMKGVGLNLTCDTSAGRAVTWKFNNNDLKNMFETKLTEDGRILTLPEVDYPVVGNYSCWSEGQMLSSYHLLFEIQGLDSSIRFHCWASSYDCSFSCRLLSSANKAAAVRVGLGPECAQGSKSCQWVSSSSPQADGGFLLKLFHSLPPYAEEKNRLQVTVEVLVNESVMRETRLFFLREIIEPDSPQIVSCQKMDQKTNVTIKPSPTWSSPHSFFSLEHETEYELKDGGETESTLSTLVPLEISRLRVRSRDSLLQSSWSKWSDWKNEADC